jgi:hypothetical protein
MLNMRLIPLGAECGSNAFWCHSVRYLIVQLPPILNAATSIMTQMVLTTEARTTTEDPLVAIANGAAKSSPNTGALETGSPSTVPHAKLSAQLFSLDNQSVSKLKMQLFEKVGEALGVKLESYIDFSDFAKDVEAAYIKMKREGGQLAINAIERETGLDKLGLTLRDVVESMKDPEGEDKVSKALIEEYNLEDPSEPKDQMPDLSNWL